MKYSEGKIIRAKVLADTLFFTRYFFKKRQKRKFVVNWHHKEIADKLDKIYLGEIKKLIIRIPPRYGKTELAVKNFIAKGLAINPKSKFIHLSYSAGLALDNSEEVRDFITDEDYTNIFPNVHLSVSSKAKNKWYTKEGGGVYATATGGQITGFGAGEVDEEQELSDALDEMEKSNHFAGAIVIDDPLKPDDADSELKRERVNQRFENTIRSRTNSRNTPIIIIGQAVHERDLAGYLIENEPDEWEVLTLPAILNEGQKDETPLWKFKQTLQELHKLREADTRTFNTQYQQNPTDEEGKLIPKTSLTHYTIKDEPIESLAFFDPADKGGDRLSGVFIDVHNIEGKIKFFMSDAIHTIDGIDAVCERIPDYVNTNKTEEIYIESNGLGIALIKGFKRELEDIKIKPIHQSIDKDARILGNYEKIIKYFVFKEKDGQSKEYRQFLDHLTKFSREGTNTHKKDAIDVASFAAQILYVKYKKVIFSN